MKLNCFAFFSLFLLFAFIFKANAQEGSGLTVIPQPYERALRNPLMGFTDKDVNHPWASTTHIYINWNELENHESDGIDKILSVSNTKFSGLAAINKKAIVRVILHYPNKDPEKYWPSDMTTDDYTSEQFKTRVLRLIKRLGIAWDNDPRVAFVELGIFGKWGEQHSPTPTLEMQNLAGQAFVEAFKTKKVSIRQIWNHFKEFSFGEYWDSWGHYDQMWGHGESINKINDAEGLYKHTYIGGEVAYDWGNGDIQPGASPTLSVAVEKHRNYVINTIRWLHCTQLRWISAYDRNNAAAVAGAEEIQKAFGYRFVLDEVRVSMDDSLKVSFDVRNEGSAPFYYNWPVEVALLNASTLQPVWKSVMKSADIREWLPGSGWTGPEWTQTSDWRGAIPHETWTSSGISGWSVQPRAYTVDEKFQVNLPSGNYVLALAILDPGGMLPGVRFATANYINGGRHPMAIVNPVAATVAELPASFSFDEPFNDKSLYYDPTINTTRYTISSTTPNGSLILSPAGGN